MLLEMDTKNALLRLAPVDKGLMFKLKAASRDTIEGSCFDLLQVGAICVGANGSEVLITTDIRSICSCLLSDNFPCMAWRRLCTASHDNEICETLRMDESAVSNSFSADDAPAEEESMAWLSQRKLIEAGKFKPWEFADSCD